MGVSLWAVWNLPVLDRRDRDQAAGRGLFVEELCPAIVGKDPLDKVLAQWHVVQAALFFHRKQRKTVREGAGEHAGAGACRHAVLVVDFDAVQARGRRVFLIRLDTNDKTASPLRFGSLFSRREIADLVSR
jgi:hypothetical protein